MDYRIIPASIPGMDWMSGSVHIDVNGCPGMMSYRGFFNITCKTGHIMLISWDWCIGWMMDASQSIYGIDIS
ncbi:hypothetical protein DWX59_00045 [Enterocloster aldenensis]|nr:hypothetical protein [Clostridiales bacterium AHG0011]RGC29947.1 hypothetical protein DWX59_00045 [Enterocloster aldenensis]RGC63334.1 hypothetical protein DW690_06305 [Dorea longicatena]